MKTLQITLTAIFCTALLFTNNLYAAGLKINEPIAISYKHLNSENIGRQILEEATKVYPNPGSDFFKIQIDSEEIKGEMTITLISQTTGEIATSKRFLKMEDFHTEELDLTWAQEGKYTMIITNGRTSIRRNLLLL